MSGSIIKLHPKYRMAPVIPKCFYCGKERNEVVLLAAGRKGDDHPPMSMVVDRIPCDHCNKTCAATGKGVAMIEAEPSPEGPSVTGRVVVTRPRHSVAP